MLNQSGENLLLNSDIFVGLLVSRLTGGLLRCIQYWQPEEKYNLLALHYCKGYFGPVNIFRGSRDELIWLVNIVYVKDSGFTIISTSREVHDLFV